LYDEAIRVPLMLRAPGAVPVAKSGALVSLVDVAPSLMTIAGLTYEAPALDGRNLFTAQGAQFQFSVADAPQIAELIIPERCVMRAVVSRDWKYLAASAWAEPKDRFALAEAHRDTANAIAGGTKQAPPTWGTDAREALLREPGDAETPIAEQAGARDALAAALAEYRKRCETSGIPPRGPTVSAKAVDADQVENLESLGYL
jgi:arylsulfatase A-like enzyme